MIEFSAHSQIHPHVHPHGQTSEAMDFAMSLGYGFVWFVAAALLAGFLMRPLARIKIQRKDGSRTRLK